MIAHAKIICEYAISDESCPLPSVHHKVEVCFKKQKNIYYVMTISHPYVFKIEKSALVDDVVHVCTCTCSTSSNYQVMLM